MHQTIKWLTQPEHHDYPAALSYLCLHFALDQAGDIVGRLHKAEVTEFKAKDLLRASRLPLLGISNSHVEHNREKIRDGKSLSPILLVRGEPLIIADGYHRMCAVHSYDEDALIPCKIV